MLVKAVTVMKHAEPFLTFSNYLEEFSNIIKVIRISCPLPIGRKLLIVIEVGTYEAS